MAEVTVFLASGLAGAAALLVVAAAEVSAAAAAAAAVAAAAAAAAAGFAAAFLAALSAFLRSASISILRFRRTSSSWQMGHATQYSSS